MFILCLCLLVWQFAMAVGYSIIFFHFLCSDWDGGSVCSNCEKDLPSTRLVGGTPPPLSRFHILSSRLYCPLGLWTVFPFLEFPPFFFLVSLVSFVLFCWILLRSKFSAFFCPVFGGVSLKFFPFGVTHPPFFF